MLASRQQVVAFIVPTYLGMITVRQFHFLDTTRQCVMLLAYQSTWGLVIGYNCHLLWCVCITAETHWGTWCSPKKSWGSEKKTWRIKSQEQSTVQRSENPEGTDRNLAGERKTRRWAHRRLTGTVWLLLFVPSPADQPSFYKWWNMMSFNDTMTWTTLGYTGAWWIKLWQPEVSAKALHFGSDHVKAAKQHQAWQSCSQVALSCNY